MCSLSSDSLQLREEVFLAQTEVDRPTPPTQPPIEGTLWAVGPGERAREFRRTAQLSASERTG